MLDANCNDISHILYLPIVYDNFTRISSNLVPLSRLFQAIKYSFISYCEPKRQLLCETRLNISIAIH